MSTLALVVAFFLLANLVVQAGRSALAAELDKLWQQEWRAGKWLELQEPAR